MNGMKRLESISKQETLTVGESGIPEAVLLFIERAETGQGISISVDRAELLAALPE